MDFQTFIGKAMSDEKFAEALASNPEQTLRDAGIEPTPAMLDALKGVDAASVKRLAMAFGDSKAAGG